MSSSNDTNRIEAGDLLIEKNASGEIEIHNLADGESVTIGTGGLSANAIDTDELSTKERPVINVQNFGADPTGQSDSTPAIRDAVAYAKGLGRPVTVYVPAGEYYMGTAENEKSPIELHFSDVTLAGDGMHSTIFKMHHTSSYFYDDIGSGASSHKAGFISAFGDRVNGNKIRNVTVRDLGVHYVEGTPGSNIVGNYIEDSVVRNVFVDTANYKIQDGQENVGIWWGRNESTKENADLRVENCRAITSPGSNPSIEMSGTITGQISDCSAVSVNNIGIKVQFTEGVSVTDCDADATSYGIELLDSTMNIVDGSYISSGDVGVRIAGQETAAEGETRISDCIIEGKNGTGRGIRLWGDGTGPTSISDTLIKGHSEAINYQRDRELNVSNVVIDADYAVTIQDYQFNADLNMSDVKCRRGGMTLSNHGGGSRFWNLSNIHVINSGSAVNDISFLNDSNGYAPTNFIISNCTCNGTGVIDIADSADNFIATHNRATVQYGGAGSNFEISGNI